MVTTAPEDSLVGPQEVEDVELYHPKSWITKYVFSQDAKVIAIQYSTTAILVGLVALVLSGMMRMQIGFPGSIDMDATAYYQAMTMHGMIMVIYLLTAIFLGGFGNYLIPLMVGARDMVFPFVNMLSFWFYLVSVLVLLASFFVVQQINPDAGRGRETGVGVIAGINGCRRANRRPGRAKGGRFSHCVRGCSDERIVVGDVRGRYVTDRSGDEGNPILIAGVQPGWNSDRCREGRKRREPQ